MGSGPSNASKTTVKKQSAIPLDEIKQQRAEAATRLKQILEYIKSQAKLLQKCFQEEDAEKLKVAAAMERYTMLKKYKSDIAYEILQPAKKNGWRVGKDLQSLIHMDQEPTPKNKFIEYANGSNFDGTDIDNTLQKAILHGIRETKCKKNSDVQKDEVIEFITKSKKYIDDQIKTVKDKYSDIEDRCKLAKAMEEKQHILRKYPALVQECMPKSKKPKKIYNNEIFNEFMTRTRSLLNQPTITHKPGSTKQGRLQTKKRKMQSRIERIDKQFRYFYDKAFRRARLCHTSKLIDSYWQIKDVAYDPDEENRLKELIRKDVVERLDKLSKLKDELTIECEVLKTKVKTTEPISNTFPEVDPAMGFHTGKRGARCLVTSNETVEPSVLASTDEYSAKSLGALTAIGLCLGFILKRFYNRVSRKRRDSFGFLPDSRRTSLNAAERMV